MVTVVFALGAAGIGALAAGLLRVSPLLGYLGAGLALGPHTPGFVADIPTVEDLADIGVALLMFAIGVQLSFGGLRRVGRVALAGGTLQVLFVIAAGVCFGRLVGWGWLEAFFFGAILSNSSSTVLSKVLADRGEEASVHGQIAIAWSTVQDFGTVILVVMLTTLSQEESAHLAQETAEAVGLAIVFLVIVVPLGLVTLPRLFERVAAFGSPEIFVFTATTIALGIAFLATAFGVSVALGAFVGGLLVGRSDLSHEVLGQIRPLRDIFAGLFFVSVGMLLDPVLVARSLPLVLAAVALLIVFKGTVSAGITAAFGYGGRTALATGVLLAQSAEFSFVMARVGTDQGTLSEDVFGVVLAAAVISIVAAPLLASALAPLGSAIEVRLPARSGWLQPGLPGSLERHVILCGHGRVGRVIATVLRDGGLPFAVIEQDGAIVHNLRQGGDVAFHGNAGNYVLLEQAGIRSARALVIAIPDPLAARQIVEFARRANPLVDIVARTHSEAERQYLEAHGADEAVVGELELALEMARHVLVRVGVPAEEALRGIGRVRSAEAETG